jgi:acyl-ACP thioesterase
MRKNVFTQTHLCNTYEVDFKKELRPNNIFMLLQEAATRAANALGVGQDNLDPYHTAWVLSRVQVNIKRIPTEFENVRINTWPIKPMFTFHPRNFEVLSENNEVLMEANTIWTLLDLKERNISNIDIHKLGFPTDLEEKSILPLPKKIDVSKVEYKKVYYPLYSDLDINNHVNNTRYVAWMMDMLSLSEIEEIRVTSITTNYIHELKYNDEVHLGYYKDENSYTFAFKKDEEVCFSAKVEFERR